MPSEPCSRHPRMCIEMWLAMMNRRWWAWIGLHTFFVNKDLKSVGVEVLEFVCDCLSSVTSRLLNLRPSRDALMVREYCGQVWLRIVWCRSWIHLARENGAFISVPNRERYPAASLFSVSACLWDSWHFVCDLHENSSVYEMKINIILTIYTMPRELVFHRKKMN